VREAVGIAVLLAVGSTTIGAGVGDGLCPVQAAMKMTSKVRQRMRLVLIIENSFR
jgi:F0F1-type ATP synthase membrane subunit c/vacuolar-type H+-ATPase subunit K